MICNKIQVFLSFFREMNYKCPCCQALDNYISGRTSQWYTLIAESMMFELKSVCWDFISFSAEKASGGKCTPNTSCALGHMGRQAASWIPCSTFLTIKLLLFLSWVTYIVGSFHLLVYVLAGYFCCFNVYMCVFMSQKSVCMCTYICTLLFFRFL